VEIIQYVCINVCINKKTPTRNDFAWNVAGFEIRHRGVEYSNIPACREAGINEF
jgi:hypothetical protein